MRPDKKRTKVSNYNNFFKEYLKRIKKESPGIISDKIIPESDISIWISGSRG